MIAIAIKTTSSFTKIAKPKFFIINFPQVILK